MKNTNHEDKEIIKFFGSKAMMICMTIFMLCAYGLFLFTVLYEPCRVQLSEEPWTYVILALILFGFSTISFVGTAKRWFTKYEIDSTGLKTSLFCLFHKKSIKWDEIVEMRYYERILPFVIISNNQTLEGVDYNKAVKQKGTFQINLTPKVYKAIKNYANQPIIGLSENMAKLLNDN